MYRRAPYNKNVSIYGFIQFRSEMIWFQPAIMITFATTSVRNRFS